VVAAAVSTGPALVFGDPVRHDRPFALLFNVAGNHYEVRPNAVALDVWLGTNAGPTNQFARLYLSDGVYQRGRAASMGDWQTVPYSAANFTTDTGGTWADTAGTVLTQGFTVIGQTMHYRLSVFNSNVTGAAPTELRVALPAGYSISHRSDAPMVYVNAGGPRTAGLVLAIPGDTFLRFQVIVVAGTWTPTAGGNTAVFCAATFEVTG
jgi:hypothetical protein